MSVHINMAAFMLAHLGGTATSESLFRPETAAEMHAQAFSHHPALSGWTLGFQEMTLNGHRAIIHDGLYQGYVSALVLVPDQGLGLFAVLNTSVGALGDLIDAFGGRFVAEQAIASAPAAGPQTDPSGFYRPTRRPYTTIERLSRNVPLVRARLANGGELVFLGREWQPAGEDLYRDEEGDLLAILTDAKERAVGIAVGGYPFDRVPLLGRQDVHLWLAVASAVVLLMSVVVFPIRVQRRRKQGNPLSPVSRAAAWLFVAAAAAMICGVVAIIVVLSTRPLFAGVPAILGPLSFLPPVAAVLGAIALVLLVLAWIGDKPKVWERVHHVAFVVSLATMVALSASYGIMGPHLG